MACRFTLAVDHDKIRAMEIGARRCRVSDDRQLHRCAVAPDIALLAVAQTLASFEEAARRGLGAAEAAGLAAAAPKCREG
jgi:hypothetical protein